jgi:hypothetical protein
MVDEEDGNEVRFVNFEEATQWMINKMNEPEEKKAFSSQALWACELTGTHTPITQHTHHTNTCVT